jgi:hypothetical protein
MANLTKYNKASVEYKWLKMIDCPPLRFPGNQEETRASFVVRLQMQFNGCLPQLERPHLIYCQVDIDAFLRGEKPPSYHTECLDPQPYL